MTHLHGAYAPGRHVERRGPFVILEGISGIGKSTLARTLTQRLDALSLHTVPDPHHPWCAAINAKTGALSQFAFYLSGVLHSTDLICGFMQRGPVVADRYISSVIAYHSAVHQLDMDQVRGLLAPFLPYLVHPDRTFYLRCNDETLKARMSAKRDFNKDDHDMLTVPGRLELLRQNFDVVAAQDPTAVIVDTDDRTPDELADTIVRHLEM
ncbi:thymidylate kinase [Streptomyces agglomeratus]|uniref:dTMP kinase n=1 Tax=Streptomyces agglomeratus TaxID=285458 RepID=UPI0008526010|nr:thymidylate kinase [Streptomyces agglomeratus]OEJ57188.1 thymidylate kinase [Streptomyces agglomeratus]